MRLATAEDLIKMGFTTEQLEEYANDLLKFAKKDSKPAKSKGGNENNKK